VADDTPRSQPDDATSLDGLDDRVGGVDGGAGEDPREAAVDLRSSDEKVAAALGAFALGEVAAPDVVLLSDMDRAGAGRFTAAWQGLPEPVRRQVVRWMVDLAEDRIELNFGRALRVAVEDASAVVRQLAIAGLWEDEGRDLPTLLLIALREDPSQDVRAEAAQVLGRTAARAGAGEDIGLDADRLRDILVAVAADETEPEMVRRRALEAVSPLGEDDEEIADLIVEAYEGDDSGLRAGAVYAMGRTLNSRWLETVRAELSSDDAELRYEAARASGELGDDAALSDLAALAGDGDAEVRTAAIAALGQIGGRGGLRILRQLADDPDPVDAEAVEAALEEALVSVDPLQVRP
jgi:HEAT repeat protein